MATEQPDCDFGKIIVSRDRHMVIVPAPDEGTDGVERLQARDLKVLTASFRYVI
jgi:hypothetical protein